MINATINQLVDRLKAFADGHFYIKSFVNGEITDEDLSKNMQYPIMRIDYTGVQPSPGQNSYNFSVWFVDLPRRKAGKLQNIQEIHSDMTLLALDLLKELRNGQILFGSDVDVQDGVNIVPFTDENHNFVSGVTMDINILVNDTWNACIIPADFATGGTGYPSESLRTFALPIYDEGNFVVDAYNINFVGSGVTVTYSGNRAIVTITGGGGGGGITCDDLDACATIIGINEAIDALTTRVTTAESDIDTLQTSVSSLGTRVTTAESDIDALESAVNAVESDVSNIQTSVTALDGRVTAVEGDTAQLITDVTNLDGRVTAVEGDVTTLQGDVTTLQGNVTSLDSRLDTAESEIDTLQSQYAGLATVATTGSYNDLLDKPTFISYEFFSCSTAIGLQFPGSGAARFFAVTGILANNTITNSAFAATYIGVAGVLDGLTVVTTTSQPSTGSQVWEIYYGSNPASMTGSGVTVTIAANSAAGIFTTLSTFSLPAGNYIAFREVNNASTNSATLAVVSTVFKVTQ